MVPKRTTPNPGPEGTTPVRVLRKERRITQAELAQAVGVSRQTIVAVEAGDYAPSVYLALRIGRALGATVEDLFGAELGTDDDAPNPGGLP